MFNRYIPPITKNLLIINALMYVLTFFILKDKDLNDMLGLHYFGFSTFKPFQLFSYMFMHGNFMHILFNMIGVYMFGSALEERLGPQKFLLLYLVSGIGAALMQMGVYHYEIKEFLDAYSIAEVQQHLDVVTVGASGSLFGLLAGFGMLFPNTELMMMFVPVPIKAKYFVLIYGAIELFSGFSRFDGDNVAHFAHVGGAIFGFLLIKYWKKTTIL
jgi:membrane associated rhomboid family serine protease